MASPRSGQRLYPTDGDENVLLRVAASLGYAEIAQYLDAYDTEEGREDMEDRLEDLREEWMHARENAR